MEIRRAFVFAICFATSVSVFSAVSRTAVSVTGSDTNPCTPVSGGEVIALDSGGYGPFTISQPVTVQAAPGVYAGVTVPSSGTGVTVTASGVVVIRGLTISGPGASYGIYSFLISTLLLHIENCSISSVDTGLFDFDTTGALSVDRTVIRDCNIAVRISANAPSVRAELITNSRLEGNSVLGLFADSYGDCTVRNTTIAGTTGQSAVWARTGASAGVSQSVHIVLENSMVAFSNVGVKAEGAGAVVTISRSALNRNAVGCTDSGTLGSGTIRSLGDNNMQDNTAPCAPTLTVSFH